MPRIDQEGRHEDASGVEGRGRRLADSSRGEALEEHRHHNHHFYVADKINFPPGQAVEAVLE